MYRRTSVAVVVLQLGLLNVSSAYSTMLANAWAAYKVALVKRPILTKSVTAAVIASASDAMTQRIEPKLPAASADTKKARQLTTTDNLSNKGSAVVPFRHNWSRTFTVFMTGLVSRRSFRPFFRELCRCRSVAAKASLFGAFRSLRCFASLRTSNIFPTSSPIAL